MVHLRVLVGAMLGTGLMGFGIGYQIGQRTFSIGKTDGGTSTLPVCSVEAPDFVSDRATPATTNRTVRVPRFKVKEGQANLIKGAGSELTEAVVKAINSRTAYRAIQNGDADMELTGDITDFCCRCPPGGFHEGSDIREMETHLVVELTWQDLHTGETLLTKKGDSRPATVELRSVAYWRPEIGESIELSRRENLERMADQIVLMMDTRKGK